MTKLVPGARAMRERVYARMGRLRHANHGVAMIEAAFTLPTLLFVSLAGIETANIMVTHTRISAIALSVADNASRIASGSDLSLPQVREADINDVFIGAQRQAGTLPLATRGRIILSSLQVNSSGGQWIQWQRCFGNVALRSAYGPQGTGATGTSFPGMGDVGSEIKAGVGAPVMFVEITYDYQPVVIGSLIQGSTQINYEAAFMVRDNRDTSQIFNPSPQSVVRSCATTGGQRATRSARRTTGAGFSWRWWST